MSLPPSNWPKCDRCGKVTDEHRDCVNPECGKLRSAAPVTTPSKVYVVYYGPKGLAEIAEFDDRETAAAFAASKDGDCDEDWPHGRLVGSFVGERVVLKARWFFVPLPVTR